MRRLPAYRLGGAEPSLHPLPSHPLWSLALHARLYARPRSSMTHPLVLLRGASHIAWLLRG